MYLWVAIDTRDRYKRICAVADTVDELATMCHVSKNAIYASISRAKRGIVPEKYIKLELPDEEEDVEALIQSVDLAADYNSTVPDKDWEACQAIDLKHKTEEILGCTRLNSTGGKEK